MAKVTYIGPSLEVTVPKAKATFKRGVAGDCPDDVAVGLNREVWELSQKIIKAQDAATENNTKQATAEIPQTDASAQNEKE